MLQTITTAALLIAWCGLAVGVPWEGRLVGTLLLGLVSVYHAADLLGAANAAANARLGQGRWWGFDAWVRWVATPVAVGGGLALALWACLRASVDLRLGGWGALLVLLTFAAVGAKLVAETYLFAQLGGPGSDRQTTAERLIGTHSLATKLRYFLGVMGGVVLPLGAQILAGGSKEIPAVPDATLPAAFAVAALVCLLPGELLERRLFWRA